MKAIYWSKYGAPATLAFREVEKPTPKSHEVLIKIHSATVTAGDCELRRFDIAPWIWLPVRLYMGIFKPRISILGQELSGTIERVGNEVTHLKVGDSIFSDTGMSMGAYAEYICLSAAAVQIKPKTISFEEAATIPTGGINGLHFLRKAEVKKGDRILINGAGGSIGTYAVQMAKALGAEVSVVDSAKKLPMLRAIGADYTIDYRQEDFTSNGKTYDAIIDIVGSSPFGKSLKSLSKNGRYVLGNPRLFGMLRGLWTSTFSSKKVLFSLASPSKEGFDFLINQFKNNALKAVIDRYYTLKEIPEAHTYVEAGHKVGNVVIQIVPSKTKQ